MILGKWSFKVVAILATVVFISGSALAQVSQESTEPLATGKCTSANADGTPEGEECKCSAEGPRAVCNKELNGIVVCSDDPYTGPFVACKYTEDKGCSCIHFKKGERRQSKQSGMPLD